MTGSCRDVQQYPGVMIYGDAEVSRFGFIQEEDVMNAEQLKGKWTHFKGELKQKWGKFTDDDLKQIEGNYEKFIGKVQERYAGKKVELMKWADAWQAKPAATKAVEKKPR
jgi:uncharacterized protein YjbJ (UPF0337 family)